MKVFVSTAGAKGGFEQIGGCSATLIHPSGVVLTNWHCIGHTNQYGADDSGLSLKHGDMFHPEGLVPLGPTLDPKDRPVQTYVGKVVQGSPDLDIAVMKIGRMYDPAKALPSPLPLSAVPIGDSNNVKIGDRMHIFGYPGAGGPLLTITSGQISGFFRAFGEPTDPVDAFKTDADVESGNSGGLATNDQGEQIGIPAFGPKNSRLAGVVLINTAKPFILKALQNAPPIAPRM